MLPQSERMVLLPGGLPLLVTPSSWPRREVTERIWMAIGRLVLAS